MTLSCGLALLRVLRGSPLGAPEGPGKSSDARTASACSEAFTKDSHFLKGCALCALLAERLCGREATGDFAVALMPLQERVRPVILTLWAETACSRATVSLTVSDTKPTYFLPRERSLVMSHYDSVISKLEQSVGLLHQCELQRAQMRTPPKTSASSAKLFEM